MIAPEPPLEHEPACADDHEVVDMSWCPGCLDAAIQESLHVEYQRPIMPRLTLEQWRQWDLDTWGPDEAEPDGSDYEPLGIDSEDDDIRNP